MKLTENFIPQSSNPRVFDFGQYKNILRYNYENEQAGEVKTYKMSKEELRDYLNKYK